MLGVGRALWVSFYRPFNHETVIQFLRNPELYLITGQSVWNEFAKILWKAQADVCNLLSKGASLVLWLLLARVPPWMPLSSPQVATSRFLGLPSVWVPCQKYLLDSLFPVSCEYSGSNYYRSSGRFEAPRGPCLSVETNAFSVFFTFLTHSQRWKRPNPVTHLHERVPRRLFARRKVERADSIQREESGKSQRSPCIVVSRELFQRRRGGACLWYRCKTLSWKQGDSEFSYRGWSVLSESPSG